MPAPLCRMSLTKPEVRLPACSKDTPIFQVKIAPKFARIRLIFESKYPDLLGVRCALPLPRPQHLRPTRSSLLRKISRHLRHFQDENAANGLRRISKWSCGRFTGAPALAARRLPLALPGLATRRRGTDAGIGASSCSESRGSMIVGCWPW